MFRLNERTKRNVVSYSVTHVCAFFFTVLPWNEAGQWGGNYSWDGFHARYYLQPPCPCGYYGRVLHLWWYDACILHFLPILSTYLHVHTHRYAYVYNDWRTHCVDVLLASAWKNSLFHEPTRTTMLEPGTCSTRAKYVPVLGSTREIVFSNSRFNGCLAPQCARQRACASVHAPVRSCRVFICKSIAGKNRRSINFYAGFPCHVRGCLYAMWRVDANVLHDLARMKRTLRIL